MVAISLYRGNLHRVSDVPVPRRWVMPRPQISMKDFRRLLGRRSKAFSLFKAGIQPPPPRSHPPTPPKQHRRPDRQIEEEDVNSGVPDSNFPATLGVEISEGNVNPEDRKVKIVAAEEIDQLVDCVSLVKAEAEEITIEDHEFSEDNNNERREKEIEEKLEILKRRKHTLVLALKQISNVEEELKMRSNMSIDSASITRVANGF